MILKRFAPAAALFAALALLVSCSTLDRIQRLNTEHALQRQNYLSPDAVNLWPFFFATGDYVSVLWPMIDWDGRGFAVRPLVNKEGDDWSLLFPLAGWDSGNGNGWCALGYWNVREKKYGFFPIFHYNGSGDMNYAGPFWMGRKSGGLFPLVWVYDDACVVFPLGFFFPDSTTVFPLFYADSNKFLSIPVSWGKKPDSNGYYYWRHNRKTDEPIGFDGLKKEIDWRWYYALLWYGGSNDYRMIAKDGPGWEYADAYENSTLSRNLYMRDKKTPADERTAARYIKAQLDNNFGVETKEIWRGLFPFFHYETFFDVKAGPRDSDPYLFNIGGGLLGQVKRTPKEDVTQALLLAYYHKLTRKTGKTEVENARKEEKLVGVLCSTGNDERWEMTPEAAFRFQAVTRETLEHRLKLYLKKDIEGWEQAFAASQQMSFSHSKMTSISSGTYSRPVYRTQMIPTPKTREEVEKLLAEFNDPKNYLRVVENEFALFPFFSRKVVDRGGDVSTDTRTLLGLLSCFQDARYEEFQHVLGPFGYLHSLKRQEGDYEHEKARNEFSMSLLAYWFSKDRWEVKKAAGKRFSGVIDDELRRRMVITDPREIAEWEKNFYYRLDAESDLAVPRTAADAKKLLEEKNATANYEENHETGYGVAPFFAHREHKDLTDTGVLLDLVFRYKRSPLSDVTHLLGPFVFYSSRNSNDPVHASQKKESNFFLSLLFYRGEDEWLVFKDAAKKKFSAVSPYDLSRRFRMTDPKEIAEWERELTADYWFADPQTPRSAPASAAAAKALYQEYFDLSNYTPRWKKICGVLPFFHYERTRDSAELNILLAFIQWKKSPETDMLQVFAPLGYLHEKNVSAADAPAEHQFANENTCMLLAYSGTAERFVRSEESEKKYQDLPIQNIRARIRMGEKCKPEKIAEWKKQFELDVWSADPRSARTAPATLDAAKKLHLEYQDAANFRKQTTESWGMFPFADRKVSDKDSEFGLFGGLLSKWTENRSSRWYKFNFHVLGPMFLHSDERSTGHFEHNTRENRFTLAGLLFYHQFENKFVRSAAGEKQAHSLMEGDIRTRIMEKAYGTDKKFNAAEWESMLARRNMRLDGTVAFPIPKSTGEAKKLWLDYNAPENYEANPYESFGFAPLFHYGSDKLGRKTRFVVPALLTWHMRDDDSWSWGGPDIRTRTCVLAGLLYAGSTRESKNPLESEWIDDLPSYQQIKNEEAPFIEGDADMEDASFSGSSSRFLLIAANNRGRALFWKKDTPDCARDVYYALSSQAPHLFDLNIKLKNGKPADSKSEEFWQKRENLRVGLTQLGLDPAKMKNELGCAQLRKQILDRWVEIRDMSERGRFGKIVYRYGRVGDDAAFWLGGGALAKYTRQDGVEDTSVLGFLYRSHADAKSTSRIIFPFIAMREDESQSQFSFLWRLVNVEKKKSGGVSGHILFIPF